VRVLDIDQVHCKKKGTAHHNHAYAHQCGARLVHADEAANHRKGYEAETEQQPEKDQRAILEAAPGAALEQVEHAVRNNI